MSVGKHGETAYAITAFGRAALLRHYESVMADAGDRLAALAEELRGHTALMLRFREQRERAERVGECLLWRATKPNSDGYAEVRIRGVGREYAHRLSWEDAFGPVPTGGHVLHLCDTPLCIEPRHLFLGDQRSNTADMRAKGRDNTSGLQRRGEWTHCKRGHLLAGENLIANKDGSRECRACRRARARHA